MWTLRGGRQAWTGPQRSQPQHQATGCPRPVAVHSAAVNVLASTKPTEGSSTTGPKQVVAKPAKVSVPRGSFGRAEDQLVTPRSSVDSNVDWFYSEAAQKEWVSAVAPASDTRDPAFREESDALWSLTSAELCHYSQHGG